MQKFDGFVADAATIRPRGTAESRPSMRTVAVVVLALLCLVLYGVRYLPAHGNGSDFQVFYAAGYAARHGIDPFDWTALWRVEQLLYNGGIGHTSPFAFAPYADFPPMQQFLRFATFLTESDAYRLWAIALVALASVGTYLALALWPRQSRLAGALAAGLCPAALFDTRIGQNSLILAAALGVALFLIGRDQPFLAGVVLSLGMFKPHLALPLALIVALSAPRGQRANVLKGMSAGILLFVTIAVATDGAGIFSRWLGSVHGFSASIRFQPDLASVPGIYLAHVGTTAGWILNAVCLLLAVLVVFALQAFASQGCERDRIRLLGAGIAVMLTLSPYVHTSDQVLLAIPLLFLAGPNGRGLAKTPTFVAAIVALLSPMVVLTNYHTTGINALPPLLTACAFGLWQPSGADLTVAKNRTAAVRRENTPLVAHV